MSRASSVPEARLTLAAQTAAELMMPNPVSIRDVATVAEAVAVLTGKGLTAAPVIDAGGRPIGVVSRTDLLVHAQPSANTTSQPDPTSVRDIMTPAVFSITDSSPAQQVIAEMLALKIQQLFVVDADGDVVGVITALDVLRHLHVA